MVDLGVAESKEAYEAKIAELAQEKRDEGEEAAALVIELTGDFYQALRTRIFKEDGQEFVPQEIAEVMPQIISNAFTGAMASFIDSVQEDNHIVPIALEVAQRVAKGMGEVAQSLLDGRAERRNAVKH